MMHFATLRIMLYRPALVLQVLIQNTSRDCEAASKYKDLADAFLSREAPPPEVLSTVSEMSQVNGEGSFQTTPLWFYQMTNSTGTQQVGADTFLWTVLYDPRTQPNPGLWFLEWNKFLFYFILKYCNHTWCNLLSISQKNNSQDDNKITFYLFSILS